MKCLADKGCKYFHEDDFGICSFSKCEGTVGKNCPLRELRILRLQKKMLLDKMGRIIRSGQWSPSIRKSLGVWVRKTARKWVDGDFPSPNPQPTGNPQP